MIGLLAVYGSLRRGQFNYKGVVQRYGKDKVKYLATQKINGYAMFDTGVGYPVGFKHRGSLMTVDVLYIHSPEAGKAIEGMEIGAGYHEVTVQTKMGPASMWIQHSPLVSSGDWVEYQQAQTPTQASS